MLTFHAADAETRCTTRIMPSRCQVRRFRISITSPPFAGGPLDAGRASRISLYKLPPRAVIPECGPRGPVDGGDGMPIVRVEMWPGRTHAQKAKLARRITEAVVEVAKTTPEATIVVFEDVGRENWAVAGRLASDAGS